LLISIFTVIEICLFVYGKSHMKTVVIFFCLACFGVTKLTKEATGEAHSALCASPVATGSRAG
jgi:hypothetical protein